VEVVHAEDAIVDVVAVVGRNRNISGVVEGVDCHSVTGLEADLGLEGVRIDSTNHL